MADAILETKMDKTCVKQLIIVPGVSAIAAFSPVKPDWLDTSFSLSMLLASSRQKPIHGRLIVGRNFLIARQKQSDSALIGLSGVLQGLGLAVTGWLFLVLVLVSGNL